jgi:excinuclease ABC subunit C
LKGRTPELLRKIKEDMLSAAEREDFEIAAELRDKLFAIKKITEKQVVVTSDQLDRDVLAMVQAREYALITILSIRGGYLTASRHFGISETLADREEMIEAFIRQYYEKQPFIPREILVPLALENLTLLETWLKNLKGGYVRVHHPVRGEKRRLMDMALENAEKELQARIESGRAAYERLERLQRRLQMETRPARIECFDNSHIMGNYPVAGMVVFAEGKPDKEAYRKFTIQTVQEPDDYAYMAEIMQRRFGKDGESEPFPDLLMVDGGKGQLNIARAVVDSLGLTGAFQLIGIAKKDERKGETADKIFLPGRSNPVNFGKDADLLLFLQHIRDEAHRFAIRFHRRRRNQGTLQSRLDAIPGIGRQRKKTLLTHFGGVRQLAEASLEDITALPGMNRKVAQAVFETFSGGEQEVGNH